MSAAKIEHNPNPELLLQLFPEMYSTLQKEYKEAKERYYAFKKMALMIQGLSLNKFLELSRPQLDKINAELKGETIVLTTTFVINSKTAEIEEAPLGEIVPLNSIWNHNAFANQLISVQQQFGTNGVDAVIGAMQEMQILATDEKQSSVTDVKQNQAANT